MFCLFSTHLHHTMPFFPRRRHTKTSPWGVQRGIYFAVEQHDIFRRGKILTHGFLVEEAKDIFWVNWHSWLEYLHFQQEIHHWIGLLLAGGLNFFVYVHPENWGNESNVTSIFLMGWFNHQLVFITCFFVKGPIVVGSRCTCRMRYNNNGVICLYHRFPTGSQKTWLWFDHWTTIEPAWIISVYLSLPLFYSLFFVPLKVKSFLGQAKVLPNNKGVEALCPWQPLGYEIFRTTKRTPEPKRQLKQ